LNLLIPGFDFGINVLIDKLCCVGYLQYRALYDYEARNADELSFNVDDIILVHPGQEHEPGWLGGELRGHVGWFPEAYAEKVGEYTGILCRILNL
jgi:hypothetical protein